MLRFNFFGILLCFLAFKSSYCLALKDTNSVYHPVTDAVPDPPPQSSETTTTHSPSTTNGTTAAPTETTKLTTTTLKPSTTTLPTTTVPTTPTTTTPIPTTSTSAPTTSPTTHSPSPITTDKPHPPPPPSDRKFDAMSFLGGFALGLGLVAIGILSWKFYLSRQENYYHTL